MADARPPVTVLVVEDDPGVAMTFARMLRLAGFTVSMALNAETGLRQARAIRPDAVLVDLRMPLVDGLTFVRQLRAREDERRTPVAVVTGDYFIAESVSRELRQLDASIYFKPLSLVDLERIIRTLTGF